MEESLNRSSLSLLLLLAYGNDLFEVLSCLIRLVLLCFVLLCFLVFKKFYENTPHKRKLVSIDVKLVQAVQ